MQLLHLRGRKRCDQVRSKGAVWKGRHAVMRTLPGQPPREIARPEGSLYVGTFAGSKLDASAVRRNRMRRRCREALRVAAAPLAPNAIAPTCLLIAPRSSSLSCSFAELVNEAQRFLSTL